ncbi:MAG: alpha/beta hydrolase [Oscillospiraceae bacterium]|jgi:acetyl esterase|nr:alpha/beta hydrolase [Oscillospiraceae bacterium]
MAINPVMKAALRALSYPDIDVKKNYKLVRAMYNAAHVHVLKPFYRTWDHRVPCGEHAVPVRIYAPNQDVSERYLDEPRPVLLFFHGGGWVTGNIDSYDKVCTDLAIHTRHLVVSVDYRLAPEYPFPAAPEDCYAVAREAFLHPGLLNARPEEITLIGDSAGGNLAAAVSLMARERGEFMPSRQILLYPATAADHHPETTPFDSIRENGTDYLLTAGRICGYLDLYKSSDEDLSNPFFAPLEAADLSGQPDTLLLTAEYDPLRDEGEAYGRRLQEAGCRVELHRMPDALHGFFSLPPNFPVVQDCYRLINRFLRGEET